MPQTDGRTDGRTDKFRFHKLCWHSQAELKMPRRMVQGKQQLKFESNPCIRFRDNCDTDNGRMDDGQFQFQELCWHHQAELKIHENWAHSGSTGSVFRDTGWFSNFHIWAGILAVAHILSPYSKGLKLSLFLVCGQLFTRYRSISKMAIFGHEA